MNDLSSKVVREWIAMQRKEITDAYGRKRDPFARGLRAQLNEFEGQLPKLIDISNTKDRP